MWLRYVSGSWQETLPLTRAELFGDGVFETLHIYKGRILFASDHLRRLHQATLAIGLELPLRLESLFEQVEQVASSFLHARAKVILYRAGEGTYLPPTPWAEISLKVSSLSLTSFPFNNPQRLVKFPVPFLVDTPWSPYKTLSALGYVQASAYAQLHRCDDAIILSKEGFLAETSRANVFFWDGKVLHTPALRSGCIAGILRHHILRIARSEGIHVEEGLYPFSLLCSAEEVFTTNVIQGITPILGVHGEKQSFRTGNNTIAAFLARKLSEQLQV
ncbi:MAG: aminotransferase class IV [Bacteroidia bacterium]|nr:aminotransferase class IV [Bacteroidia bacterium]MDW8133487.1 aminotransferase class IV [Bacteroidia bacterium]